MHIHGREYTGNFYFLLLVVFFMVTSIERAKTSPALSCWFKYMELKDFISALKESFVLQFYVKVEGKTES